MNRPQAREVRLMDIEKRGRGYRVRWYDHDGRRRSRTFKTERDAAAFGRQMEHERDAYYTDEEYAAALLGAGPDELEGLSDELDER